MTSKVLIADKEGKYVNFYVKYGANDYDFVFELYEVNGWFNDGTEISPSDTELYCEGRIKWNGCSHISLGNKGYLHLCGVAYWKLHCEVMEKLYKLAQEEIKKMDKNELWT